MSNKTSRQLKEVWRKASLQKTRLHLDYDEEGVTFDINVQSSDIYAKVFVSITHGDMAEKFGEWFASRPKEVQEGVIAMLHEYMEATPDVSH